MTESREILLCFGDDGSETVWVTFLGTNTYRLEETPVWNDDDAPVYFGDVIELELQPDGTHRFNRIVERAPLQHYSWVIHKFFADSPQYHEFRNAVMKEGGACELIMGGWLLVHVPLSSHFDIERELDNCILSAKRATEKQW